MITTSRLLVVLCLAAALAFTGWHGSALAQEGGGDYKIGVVDMRVLLEGYDKRKAKYEELQRTVDDLQVKLDDMEKAITKKKDDFTKQRADMAEEDRITKRQEIEDEMAQYQRELADRQRKIDNMEEVVLREVFGDVEAAIKKLAEEENYHLILNKRSGPTGSVLYATPTIDVTSKLLERLNKSSS